MSRRKGVRGFGSALLRRELARDGARGFRFGIGCSGVILMTRDGRRQVRIGRIGVGSVTVMTHHEKVFLHDTMHNQSLVSHPNDEDLSDSGKL